MLCIEVWSSHGLIRPLPRVGVRALANARNHHDDCREDCKLTEKVTALARCIVCADRYDAGVMLLEDLLNQENGLVRWSIELPEWIFG